MDTKDEISLGDWQTRTKTVKKRGISDNSNSVAITNRFQVLNTDDDNLSDNVNNKNKPSAIEQTKPLPVSRSINKNLFSDQLTNKINLDIENSLRNEIYERLESLTKAIHEMAMCSTINLNNTSTPDIHAMESEITDLVRYKRQLRNRWKITKYPPHKKELNKAVKTLKRKIREFEQLKISSGEEVPKRV